MNLSQDFYKQPILEINNLIKTSSSFSVMGVSDFGRTIFLKHLANIKKYQFVFVDAYDLNSLTQTNLFKKLLEELGGKTNQLSEEEIILECKDLLNKQAKKANSKLVVIFNRFDLLHSEYEKTFFDYLRALNLVNKEKITFIYGICTSLHTIAEESLMGSDLILYSQIYYLPLYSTSDLEILIKKYGPISNNKKSFEKAIYLSGGHMQLAQLILQSKYQQDLIKDEFIQLCLKNIYKHLNSKQKKIVKNITWKKKNKVDDLYLKQTGFIKNNQLFSPLMEEYIKSITNKKLSVKENKLFKLLQKNLGSVVSRDEIFEKVWDNEQDNATDWALDALAYRLRKNPAFVTQGFELENHKKIGYQLVRR